MKRGCQGNEGERVFCDEGLFYRSKRPRRRLVLIGDAWGFLDPLTVRCAAGAQSCDLARPHRRSAEEWRHVGRSGEVGPRSTKASTGCAARLRVIRRVQLRAMVKQYPEMRGPLTDLLIGDLFDPRVDKVWAPLESLYEPGKQQIPTWTAGIPAQEAPEKANELTLPEGRRLGV